jgi:hypothetical protein
VSEQSDPERLLAEALRAQAVHAPMAQAPPAPEPEAARADQPPADPPEDSAGLLGLFSGTDHQHQLLSGRAEEPTGPTEWLPPPPERTRVGAPAPVTSGKPGRGRQLSVWWVLALAILLGLAAGAVAGLLTLL